jgi:PilZ domain
VRYVAANVLIEQGAFDLRLGGRYSLANRRDPQGNRREFACRTSKVSPFQMRVDVPVNGTVGERVISYFGEFGKIDGWIRESVKGGFLFELAVTRAAREQLASKMSWLDKQQREAVVDARSQERIIPANPHSELVYADGTTETCLIIDMSASGVAVSAETQPPIGMPLAVGRTVGRVVRHFREGFAVKFVEVQDRERLESLLIRA